MDEQLRLIDLVPRKLIAFVFIVLIGFLIIGSLEALYSWMPDLVAKLSTSEVTQLKDSSIAAFDLDAEGSLGAYYSSLTLVMAALAAMLVYTIRRHRVDDYRGNYRIWIWAAMCWMLMSIDESSSLHEGFKEMLTYATGTPIMGDGSIWWAIPYFFLLGAVGTRLFVDMRECKLSTAALLTTAGCYAAAVATQLGWILPESGAKGVMLEEGLEMTGNLMLLTSMLLHARYVILDAEGLIPHKEEEEEVEEEYEEEAEEEPIGQGWMTVDKPHKVPQPASSRVNKQVEMVSNNVGRKLTKQEKKALRRKLAQERQQRERQQRDRWGS